MSFVVILTLYTYVGLFYYLLGNLSPYLRSQLKSIQLLAVATAPTIIKYGPDKVLETFMDDLKILEEVCTMGSVIVCGLIVCVCIGWNKH